MKKSLSIAVIPVVFAAMLLVPPLDECAGAERAKGASSPPRFVAVIPPDAPPTYYRDEQSGKAAGFAVDVMDAIAGRAGLSIAYVFEDGWADIIAMLKAGKADLAPGMGVSRDRSADLAFSELIDAFPISFFVRSESAGIDASSGIHTVGVIRGSVAFEKLTDRADIRLELYEGFGQGLFDLLAGKIEAFACPAPTLWQLARETGVDHRIKIVDRPVAEIKRAIAVRNDSRALLVRLNAAINSYVGTPAYQQVYTKWYGRPVSYWTAGRIVAVGAALLMAIIALMAAWRYASLLKLNRALSETIARRKETETALQRSTVELNTFFDVALDLLCIADTEGRFRQLNRAWERTLGLSRDELMAGKFLDLVHPDDVDRTLDAVATLASQKEVVNFINRYRCKDGSYRWIEWRSVPAGNLIYAAARDITEQKQAADAIRLNQERLESLVTISQRRTEHTQELLDFALEEAIRLTRSRIGYLYFYSEEKQQFTLNSWSREVMKECAIAEPQEIYQLEKTGIWGEAVRQRKPIIVQDFSAPHPLKKGYPPGHVHLRNFLTVPLFQQDRIVAVVGVANKQTAYAQDDISQLTLLMDAIWRMVENKKMETELRKSVAVLRSFLNAITESALLIDRQGRILAANETVAKRLGMTVPGLVGSNAYDSLPPDVAKRRKERMDAVFRTGVPARFEDERLGQVIDNSLYPVFDLAGAVSAIAIIGIDITERKRAASALEFSEKKYHMLYDSAIDGIFIVDVNGKFIDVNQTAHERLGYAREELLALHISRLDHPDFATKVGMRIDQLQQDGHLIFESAHRRKDGSIMPVEINARIIDYDGRKAIFSIVRDITDRKSAEQEREALIAELQKALAEIKTIHGILPICASCKKIRDDKGAWHQLEAYISRHTDAEFSHGLCADCANKLYPGITMRSE